MDVVKASIKSTKKMSDNVEIEPVGKEQKKVIDKLEEVLNFLKKSQIKNEEYLEIIKKPLDEIQSSLKYIPTDPLFETIPSEIKTQILSYLCDSKAFIAASVCQDWKEIFESRFANKTVTIGSSCCSIPCAHDYYECSLPSRMLKASATHKMDVHLSISHPIKEVDSKIVTDGLMSVSKFSITGHCTCDEQNDFGNSFDSFENSSDSFESHFTERECELNPLSLEQLQDLFKGLMKRSKSIEKVELVRLDLTQLNQDRMVNCFLKKIRKLTLVEDKRHGKPDDSEHSVMFDVEKLINKLQQEPAKLKLKKLSLDILEYPAQLSLELANALCNVKIVKLGENINLRLESVTQLIENIITNTRPVLIKALIMKKSFDFDTFINSENLKKLLIKMVKLQLQGTFTLEQVEAARSIPGVTVLERTSVTFIRKGFNVN